MLAVRYPSRRHPGANVFRLFQQLIRETGSVTAMAHANAGRLRTVRTPA
jgi:hypothetical protein